jgi:ribosomal protein L4
MKPSASGSASGEEEFDFAASEFEFAVVFAAFEAALSKALQPSKSARVRSSVRTVSDLNDMNSIS